MNTILQTPRLYLRELEQSDFENLCTTLQDAQVMYAYEHAFSDDEVAQWLERQQERYQKDGFGLWAVIRKEDGAFVGQCGLTMQDCVDARVTEVGYLFCRCYWHCGYATEAARACMEYAFKTLRCMEVYSIIRDNNIASQQVAKRNGMTLRTSFVKHYYGMDMPHLVFSIRCDEVRQCKKTIE